MPSLLTEDEKARVRKYLGYPLVGPVTTVQMGLVTPMQTLFILEGNMEALTEQGAASVRQYLAVLDMLEAKIVKAACYLVVDSIGEIKMRDAKGPQGTDLLRREQAYQAKCLGDVLGSPIYIFSERFSTGGINVRVG